MTELYVSQVGGATGSIGDPSGRNKERELQSAEIVAENSRCITDNIKTIFDNHEKYFWNDKNGKEPLKPPIVVNNISWYKKMNALEYVGKIGKHFRMGTMLCKESVDTRLKSEHGLSYTEFSYQIFQAYDWYHLLQKYNCRFQAGGSDQLGNISAGHELISRLSRTEVYGVTLPLVKTVSGAKFGKSAGNAVWLSPDMTSPFDLYQHLVRTTDADVETMLKLFTFDSVESIGDVCRKHQTRPELWLAQKRLADKVTTLVHGEEGLKAAHLATEALYNGNVDILSQLSWNDVTSVFKGAVVKDLLMEPGLNILQFSL
ncbi:tyrosine--tRNA ligase, mitochondrial-like [Nilaparvata lugens]|uniref:tyrosine--tRNA ligase, mitochondrial-like n=1 Tax=Nilaparvata lugens TaxID=108931 RepID=UPI00193E2B09|nr:tyrosine--tRNA ligase, mitochondrial-like [Nilaparvata lugens]